MVRVRVKYMILYIFIPYSSRYLRFLPKTASPTPFSAPAGANPSIFAENPTYKQIFAILFTAPPPPVRFSRPLPPHPMPRPQKSLFATDFLLGGNFTPCIPAWLDSVYYWSVTEYSYEKATVHTL